MRIASTHERSAKSLECPVARSDAYASTIRKSALRIATFVMGREAYPIGSSPHVQPCAGVHGARAGPNPNKEKHP